MNKDLTEIVLIIDRSGSMWSLKNDAQGSINTLLAEQRDTPGLANVTLVDFNTKVNTIHDGIDINEVSEYVLEPNGGTALLDAIGMTVTKVGQRLAATPENQKPGLVVVAIVTDGEENSSREYTREAVRAMIKEQEEVYNWQFSYLGANQDSFAQAGHLGMSLTGVANWSTTGDCCKNALSGTSSKFSRMRHATSFGYAVDNTYTMAELSAMQDDSDAKNITSCTSKENNAS